MWNPFKLIFQSPKALNTIVTGGMEALDHINFSEEERAEGRQKMLGTVTDYMAKTTGQDMARRALALSMAGLFIFLAACIVGFLCFEAPNEAGELYRANLLKAFMAESVSYPFMLVMLFYFAPHLIAQLVTKFISAAK